MKLCVFPNDPLFAYYNKGEIKERYYNPCNIFDEVHIISFVKQDIEEAKVQTIVGNAKLKIHSVGNVNLRNRWRNVSRIKSIVKTIKPDVIRAYNPRIEGWFAAFCSEELKIPFYLSLHTQYDNLRKVYRKSNLKKFIALKYSEKFVEPFVLKKADKITMVYRIIEPYVIRHCKIKPEVLYNRIDCKRFLDSKPIESLPSPLIISVGSLNEQKNHQCIINAMQWIDAHLLVIGNGELYDRLIELVRKLKIERKVTIQKTVANSEIQNYYKSSEVFALAYNPEQEGLPIPVMEAMASGLPVVIPFPKVDYSDGLENIAIFSQRNSSSFASNINKILTNPDLQKELSMKSLEKAKDFDNSIIETREAEIYSELLS